jgi:signal transduction histidine kinase
MRRRLRAWVVAGVASLVALAGAGSRAQEPERLTHAAFTVAQDTDPAGPDAQRARATTTVTLPDSWPRRDAPRRGHGWYHVSVPATAASGVRWVYIPRVVDSADIYLDDTLLWSGGAMSPRPSRHWSRSVLFPLPPAQGERPLRILVGVDGPQGGALGPVYVGDGAPLHRWSRWRDVFQREGVFVTSGIILATGVYLLMLWARVRESRDYLFLGLGGVVWALRNAESLLVDAPLPAGLVDALDMLAFSGHGIFFGLFGLFMLQLVERDIGKPARVLEAAIWTCIVGSALSVLASPWLPWSAYGVLSVWLWLCAPLVAYLMLRLAKAAWSGRDALRGWVATLAGIFFAASVYDNLVAIHQLPPHWIYAAHYAGLLFFVCFALLTIGRFTRLLAEYRDLNAQLNERVARQLGELQEAADRRTRLEERERIMRDLHDGLGSQLVLAIHEVRDEPDPRKLEEVLTRCLEELRLAIESLAPDAHLPSMLGQLRYRMERHLKRGAIALDWQVEDVPRLAALDSSRLLNILRVLQEAFANTLRHAGATAITVRLRQLADAVELRYEDNGRGFDTTVPARGHGISNMRHRAQASAVAFEIESRPGAGMALGLRLPLA